DRTRSPVALLLVVGARLMVTSLLLRNCTVEPRPLPASDAVRCDRARDASVEANATAGVTVVVTTTGGAWADTVIVNTRPVRNEAWYSLVESNVTVTVWAALSIVYIDAGRDTFCLLTAS